MTTKSGATHQKALLYEIFHPQSRRLPRLNVDLDAALTVITNGCYRWLASRLRGFEKAAPKQLYRRFVETGGTVQVQGGTIMVSFERRSHNPILREAALDREPISIPWLGGRRLTFTFR